MRKLILTIFIMMLGAVLFIPTAYSHELFIQVDEFEDSEELRVDILWGHIRDYVSEANIDDLELHVKDPAGEISTLTLEEVGVHYRSYVPITEEGTYTFWATRAKSAYTPEDGVPQLSNHMAKVVHHVGNRASNADEAIDMELEILPNTDISEVSIGEFEGIVRLRGDTVSDATVTAYGPQFEVLETNTDDDGNFQFAFDSNGTWLIKANVMENESGQVQGDDYDEINNTSTLLLDTTQEAETNEAETDQSNLWTYIALVVTGLLLGAGFSLFFTKKGKS